MQEIIPYEWTHIFSPTELQQIISGDSSQAIDVDGILQYTAYLVLGFDSVLFRFCFGFRVVSISFLVSV
jgi:hypothetical protein